MDAVGSKLCLCRATCVSMWFTAFEAVCPQTSSTHMRPSAKKRRRPLTTLIYAREEASSRRKLAIWRGERAGFFSSPRLVQRGSRILF